MGIKYAVDENFFEKWSSPMAYVLGFLYADGHLENSTYNRGQYVRVISTDRDRIEVIKKALRSRHTIYVRAAKANNKRAFLLRIGNQKLYASLFEIGITPRKSLVMKFPQVPRKYLGDFIRGYFDGDGCVHLERYPKSDDKPRPPKRMRTIFTSGSYDFLFSLSKLLRTRAGISVVLLHNHSKKGSYQLRLSTDASVRLFTFMYSTARPGLYLSRKYDIFSKYFKERPEWATMKVQRVLQGTR